MKKLMTSLIIIFASLGIMTAYAETPLPATNKSQDSIAPMLKRVMPAIVNITTIGSLSSKVFPYLNQKGLKRLPKRLQKGLEERKFRDVGSGIIFNAEKGYIVTNSHVIKDSSLITVTLSDGRRFRAKLIGKDTATDIAVIQIHAKNLVAVPFADSDKLQVGDFAAAIGNPFGLHQTVTSGMVSALNRDDLGIEGYENFIQTDAPINPGNSGGALVNLNGQLIGMNTAIITPGRNGGNVGIGFAIPSNMMQLVIKQLVKNGKVKRGIIGVLVQNLTPSLADAFKQHGVEGALVTDVTTGSPAAKAGIKDEDIIISVNGRKVNGAAQVRNITGMLPIGTKLKIIVRRGSKDITLHATIANPKLLAQKKEANGDLLSGVGLSNFNRIMPGKGVVTGAQVTNLTEANAAWVDGLRKGDVIVEANNEKINNIDQLQKIAERNHKQLLLKIRRAGGAVFVVLDK